MPEGPRVLDLSPKPRTQPTNLERIVEGYAEGLRRNKESDELASIYEKYKEEGMGIEQKIQAIRSNPKISNATKVNAISDLTTVAGINEKLQEKETNKQKISDIEQRRNLPPGSLAAYEDDPKMGEQISRPPKEGKTNQADRPINEDQLRRIQEVEDSPEFEKASNADKQKMLRNNLVSKENIDSVMKPYIEEGKPGQKRQEVLAGDQAKEDIKFYNDQIDQIPKLLSKEKTMQQAEALNEEGATGSLYDQALERAGLVGLTSDGRREFTSIAKDVIKNENMKAVVGSQMSREEFKFFVDATINPNFSKEANARIIRKENLALRYGKLYADITNQIVQNNEGVIPERLQAKVNDEFRIQSQKIAEEVKKNELEYRMIKSVPKGFTLMYDKDRNPLHVPNNKVRVLEKQKLATLT